MPRALAAAVVAAMVIATSACETLRYYGQVARGQAEVLWHRQPIARVLAEPDLPAPTRAQLELVQDVLSFAREQLQLPVGNRYGSFTRLPRPYAVWNVFAAPALSLQPLTWCYPLVGCVVYRGYFSEAGARAAAASLARKGHDTAVGGVRAYSTLGWFNDPILSTFIDLPPAELAALIIHELAHSVAFAAGDSDFNEGFATFVEDVGLTRWLAHNDAEVASVRADRALQRAFYAFMEAWRVRLQQLYAQPIDDDDKRARKQRTYDDMRAAYRADAVLSGRYDTFFNDGLNNARLSSVATYHARIDAFAALFGHCGSDLPAFYRAAKCLARSAPAARDAALDGLAGVAPTLAAASGCVPGFDPEQRRAAGAAGE